MIRTDIKIGHLKGTRLALSEAGGVAARAFYDDPFFCFLSPRPLLRARGLGLFARALVASIVDTGEVLAARRDDGMLVGVAAWVGPGRMPLPAPARLRQSAGAIYALYPRPKALLDGTRYLMALDKEHPREPHWYLGLLVVDPLVQRSGIGTVLQEPLLARADEEGVDCYLETQNERNIPYYGRFGYEVVKELRPVPGGPPVWTLRRRPREP